MYGWHPGDLSPSGIFLTIGYGAIGVACLRLERRNWANRRLSASEQASRALWTVLGAMFLLIALERQLGLFDLLTDVLRVHAVVDGSYQSRRDGQALILKGLAIAACVIGPLVVILASRAGTRAAGLALTATIIVGYLVAKAISLHAVDTVLNSRFGFATLGNVIEFSLAALGIALVASEAKARRKLRRKKRRRRLREV